MLNDHKYLLLRYPHLCSTSWLLTPWHSTGNPHFISCFTLYHKVLLYMIATAKASLHKGMTSPRRLPSIPIVKLSYCELEVHTVSDRCQELMYNSFLKYLEEFLALFWICCNVQGASAHCLGTWKVQSSEIKFFLYATASPKCELNVIFKSEQ